MTLLETCINFLTNGQTVFILYRRNYTNNGKKRNSFWTENPALVFCSTSPQYGNWQKTRHFVAKSYDHLNDKILETFVFLYYRMRNHRTFYRLIEFCLFKSLCIIQKNLRHGNGKLKTIMMYFALWETSTKNLREPNKNCQQNHFDV